MFAEPTLLAAHEGKSGPFINWLKKLGLEDFLKTYPLIKLIEWGWIVPQYRVPFPNRFFESWENYPCLPCELDRDFLEYDTLWGYTWDIDNDSDPLWFLDPILHPSHKVGELLRSHIFVKDSSSVPPSFEHQRGILITPFVDYFYPWQGYALVDVIRFADNIMPIYSTPDIQERAQGIVRIANHNGSINSTMPSGILTQPKRWGGLGQFMTQLDHFRSFRNAIKNGHGNDPLVVHNRYKRGARALATHIGLRPETMAIYIKDHMLVLAHDWMFLNEKMSKNSIWTIKAWPHLRADILMAISWLLLVTDKSFEDYVDEWQEPFLGDWGYAQLDEVLPYEFLIHKKKFIQLAPTYLQQFNELKNNSKLFNDSTLPGIVKRISHKNYPFEGFLSAFNSLHENLSYKPFDKFGLDFRSLRPLDHYALLAIHAEGCLRRELDNLGLLKEISSRDQGLCKYIQVLSKVRGHSEQVIGNFNSHSRLAYLHTDRVDPIGRIQSLKTNLPATEHHLVQSFLCCLLARNYFAHHDFLDHELIRSEKSAFMLSGILLTVLVLLDSGPA